MTPKLKTSDFTENNPSIAYSGAMYPLGPYYNISYLLNIFKSQKRESERERRERAYNVPTTLLVLATVWFPSNIFAIPKSDILATMSWSNNTLEGLRSL